MKHSESKSNDTGEYRLKPLPNFELGEPVQLNPDETTEFRLPPMPGFNFEQPAEHEALTGPEFRLPPVTHKPYTGPMHLAPLNTGDDAPAQETTESDASSNDDDAPPMRGSVLGLE
jgi:hypothetical protein